MTDFHIKKLPYDLSSHAGLAFIGKYLKRVNVNALIDPRFPLRAGVANSEILKSYLALLCMGKSDFDAIENFRDNAFFKRALGLAAVPLSPTLRQRMDTHAASWFELAPQMNQLLLGSRINGKAIDFGTLECGYTPVDLDTFAMDNGGTKKELIGRTYAGVDGYCPFAVYLGSLGYGLELALRPGVQHSASESEYNFERALPMAASLVSSALLVRADSGFCSLKLMHSITAQANAVRRVYRLTERTIDKHGNVLLLPEYVLEGWTTTLPQKFGGAEVIALYCDHATHEQFHSEFKTDMDLERLPSGKFDTNYLVCQLAAVAMNLLRLIGQNTLNEPDAPVRHKATRRRIKTVMQELMFKAARMIHHAGRWVLGLGESDPAFGVFERHYRQLNTA
jgi:Transposase DDE domain group 1